MIDCDESQLDGFVGDFMTIETGGLHHLFLIFGRRKEMACKTHIPVYTEVFVSFEVAVTGSARKLYSLDNFLDMIFVGEFDSVEIDLFDRQFLCTVTF